MRVGRALDTIAAPIILVSPAVYDSSWNRRMAPSTHIHLSQGQQLQILVGLKKADSSVGVIVASEAEGAVHLLMRSTIPLLQVMVVMEFKE